MKVVCVLIIIFSLFKICTNVRHVTFGRNHSLQQNHQSSRNCKICNQTHGKKGKNKTLPDFDRIIGGKPARIRDYPFTACLVTKTYRKNDEFLCGAAIIRLNWVVTAAHCVFDLSYFQIGVRSNSASWNKNYKEHHVTKLHVHKKFDGKAAHGYDIAVVKVREPFRGKYEKVAKLANINYKNVDKGTATVLGWGRIQEQPGPVNVVDDLRYVKVNLVNFKTCRKQWNPSVIIKRDMICAIAPGKDACVNDSGGPLYQNKTLIGVVSGGPTPCAQMAYPGVYARISVLHEWILRKIKIRYKYSKSKLRHVNRVQ